MFNGSESYQYNFIHYFIMQRALFSRNLAEQVSSFNSLGFVLIRQAPGTHQTDMADLAAAKKYILHHLDNQRDTWKYKMWRMFNKVATAESRHSLALPFNTVVEKVLNSKIGAIRPFLDSQLSKESSLVELNSLISLPGATQQDVHADIPFSENNLLISGYIALSDVNLIDGPTCLHGGSHTQPFHRRIPTQSIDTFYSSDGSTDESYEQPVHTESVEDKEAVDMALAAPVSYAQLKAGDVLLFNTMVFHYGSANTSTLPRALLSFSFQRNSECGNMLPINGFTYHCLDSVAGKYTLNNFPDTNVCVDRI